MEEKKKIEIEFMRVIRLYFSRTQSQLAQVGLFRGQPPILSMLYRKDGMSQKEMAHALDLSPATMTVTLKRMEKNGLIVRKMDEYDQRILRVHLTEQGRVMCEKGEKQLCRVNRELMDGFSEEEEKLFCSFLNRVAHNMERVVNASEKEDA